ncbi:hypothetical protein [Geodermatophilus sp. URMC 64]
MALPRVMQVLGSVVAPTTLLTGLFFYFGLLYAIAYYRFFGINYTVLELPFTGVLTLSASAAVLPLAVLAGAALLVLWVYRQPLDRASPAARRLVVRGLLPAVAAAGAVLLGLVGADVLFGAPVFGKFYEGRGLSLTIGMACLGYASRLRRTFLRSRRARRSTGEPVALTVAKWVCLCTLIGVGLFWAVGSYALRVGLEDARGFAVHLACGPDVTLYSARSLNLGASGVAEERSPDTSPETEQGYPFRYPGLKLVPQPGEQYLLLPPDWAPDARPAILLPRSDSLRLEFVTVLSTRPAYC